MILVRAPRTVKLRTSPGIGSVRRYSPAELKSARTKKRDKLAAIAEATVPRTFQPLVVFEPLL
jgi:hypothetical protein